MSLHSGYYLIKHQRSNKNVSRDRVEDKSLNPKRVLVLPDSTVNSDDPVVSHIMMRRYLCLITRV
ncbi:hypothetical protein FIBSPDRAFT_569464 [Athelia psychrophila]|uniref:Uncharacterized protein n=1 Tax=Athelia psychrophila TaxID=1759441 RepID=A0A167TA24_9AGAM|nr:hypothetical protein FIBSPDRAFT_569473 [Fibularhizoctonia sp. CBS 109695]KZP02727.1 hypothetical protein FIBSPDRAFT_569464 [Fibularhizoctonia sp. CBS 109695]